MTTMSSSTYGIRPSLLDNSGSGGKTWPSVDQGASDYAYPPTQSLSATSFVSNNNHLSPYSHIPSNSASPTLNNASTPADSLSAYSEHYQSSELSDQIDPFFGVDFDDNGSTPAFLDDQPAALEGSSGHSEPAFPQTLSSGPSGDAADSHTYPLSKDPTNLSIRTTSLRGNHESSRAVDQTLPNSPSQAHPKELRSVPSDLTHSHPTSQANSGTNTTRSSEDDMASATAPMPSPSPRVTVSMWGRDQDYYMGNAFPGGTNNPTYVRAAGISSDDSSAPASYQRSSVTEEGAWAPGSRSGPNGWGPEDRPVEESVSINELEIRRNTERRNREVDKWRATAERGINPDISAAPYGHSTTEDDGIRHREIPLGSETENKPLPNQIYYTERGGTLTENDFKLMRETRVWADAPMLYGITRGDSDRTQPETSKAAMERFDQMCQDTSSVLSRSATWGTRRRSLPSDVDIEGITSGSFLKKLSISRERKPSIIFRELRGLVRRPSASQLLKRSRSGADDEGTGDAESQNRRGSRDTLAPPSRTSSWTKKQQMPSLNTALVSMATGAAAIGTTHARSGSISNTTSPKSPFNLQVKGPSVLRRPRSKSDLPKGASTTDESHPNLVGMWKKSGGPPVAQLARSTSLLEQDDDDDEEEDRDEEGDMKTSSSNIIDDITPNLGGFRKQVLSMNPKLAEQNTYLVDRIAHQQCVRYKYLLNNRVKHLQYLSSHNCPSGHMCIAMGGSAIQVDVKGEYRGMDPLSTTYDGSDGDAFPLEGIITAESFPLDIPIPPTKTLPAEFECQLCYQAKKFTKPSDWTKHVHEDVQPFTCTWDACREPKIFKRKADWVRHENEGHRHLEWWTCDVEDCRHTCYRRDNFLQHLVREHKFPEPKVKTKAAIKRAGGLDPTWQKVEKCHKETAERPQDEPCRFCNKTFPTWKKLTVHLAKHMEMMSLPILRLVARKELDADTIISPVQDPPPRTFPPVNQDGHGFDMSPSGHSPARANVLTFPNNTQQPAYHYHQPGTFPNSFYDPSMSGLQQPAVNLGISVPTGLGGSFQTQAGYQSMAVSSSSAFMPPTSYISISQPVESFPALMNPLGLHSTSGNHIYDAPLDPTTTAGMENQYTHQHHGSVSPYSRSPLQGQGGFFTQ